MDNGGIERGKENEAQWPNEVTWRVTLEWEVSLRLVGAHKPAPGTAPRRQTARTFE